RKAWSDRPLCLIAGMINSKQPLGYFQPLAGSIDSVHCITIPNEAAAIPAKELAAIARKAGLRAKTARSALAATQAIASQTKAPARLLICGSLYLAGHILAEHG
ncbi:MAG: bifunctional folylpolyglutamate synthase/dihydrofolate synthase, partial [Rhodospirillales bacterium]